MTQPNPFNNPFGATATAPPTAPTAAPAAPAASAPANYGDDPFGAPAPRADRPRIADIVDRLVILTPTKLEREVPSRFKNPDGTPQPPQDRMTVDVIVLDGGELHYGGAPEKRPPRPHTKSSPVPMRIDGLYVSNAGIVSGLMQAYANRVARNGHTMVLGRIVFGEAKGDNNAPYYIEHPTDEDKALARAYLAANPIDPFGTATK